MAEHHHAVASALADLSAPSVGGLPCTLALAGSELALLVGVVGGGLIAAWIVLRLVLRETAEFSRRFPREDDATSTPPPLENGATAPSDVGHAAAAPPDSANEGRGHATARGDHGVHVHEDGCTHSGSVDLDRNEENTTR